MAQQIKYQNTTVDASRSAGHIAELVRKYGGSRFEQQWDEYGQLVGIRFAIRDDRLGEVPVILRAQTETITAILDDAAPKSWDADRVLAQAHRIAWRQLKDFVEQALLAVRTGLFPLAAAFMAHVEVRDEETGEPVPLMEAFAQRGRLGPAGHGVRLISAADNTEGA